MSMDIIAFVMPGIAELFVIMLIFPIVFILPVIVFWRICSKAGLPGALGLLILVPIVNFFLPLYVAFAEWPALRGDGIS
jgi:hypothetical protein